MGVRLAKPLHTEIMIMNHRHSIRFQKLDYSLPNKFFVTICALKHGSYFEKYPELTEIVRDEIIEIQKYFPNINITNSVIMPNHMHLIISINFCCLLFT